MMHFSCDLCGKEMRPEDHDPRYVVKIEVYPAHDPHALTEDDLEDDHMKALGDMLRSLEENVESIEMPPTHAQLRYDLCPDCHLKFLRDPLGKEQGHKLSFSNN